MSANPMVVIDLMAYDNTIIYYHFATPAEVAAAHPKCGTCRHKQEAAKSGVSFCLNPDSGMYDGNVDPALDYCRFHSELTTETT